MLPERLVAAFVMPKGIALVAIVTAAITSTFVARATHLQDVAQAKNLEKEEERTQAGFDDLSHRLNRVEGLLRSLNER